MDFFVPILAGLAHRALDRLFPPKLPPQIQHANEALIKTQQEALEKFKKDIETANTEKERLAATIALEVQRKAMAKAPVTDEKLIEEARTKHGIDCINEFNALITGDSGAGKSSFINCALGLNPTQPGAARVDVKEATTMMTSYFNPAQPHVKFWDVPGCGTKGFPFYHPEDPDLHYYRRFSLYAFTLVIFFYSNRMLEGTATLVQTCVQSGQLVAIVRNKADLMVGDLMDDGVAANEAQARELAYGKFEAELREQLGDLANRVPHFLISTRLYRQGTSTFDDARLAQFIADRVRDRANQ